MDPPKVEYEQDLYDYLKSMKDKSKEYNMYELRVLGQGAAGTTYSAYVKPADRFPNPIVLKEQKRDCHCINEYEALKILRKKMLAGELPGYYIFMYDSFNSGNKKYIVLELADICLDDYLVENDVDTKGYLQIFWHIANAVSMLEDMEFNHGDLWSENVMLKWLPDQEESSDDFRFQVKIIDFDSAFKKNSRVKNPSYGGADKYRNKFILGYDLNRFFDSLLYSYESYIGKKEQHKKRKIARLRKLRKKGKKVKIPRMEDVDSDDEAFDADNIVYPKEIIDFIYSLKPEEPNCFEDCPEISGKAVMRKIEEYAVNLDIDLYDN